MTVVSAFATEEFFEVDYRFGQNDLVNFAKYAQKHDLTISTSGLERKYSLLYYNDENVDFDEREGNIKCIKEDLKKEGNVVILKNKVLQEVDKEIDYQLVKKGRRYSMIKGVGK